MLRFPWWSLLLWAVNFGLEAAVLYLAVRRRSVLRLYAFHALLAVTVTADLARAGIILAGGTGNQYAWMWWSFNTAEMVLRSGLALQLLWHLLKTRRTQVILATTYAVAWLTWAISQHFRGEALSLLTLSSAANVLTLLLCAAAVIAAPGDWPRGWSTVLLGLFLESAIGTTLALIQRATGLIHSQVFIALWQCAPFITLLLWLEVARDGERDAPKANGQAA